MLESAELLVAAQIGVAACQNLGLKQCPSIVMHLHDQSVFWSVIKRKKKQATWYTVKLCSATQIVINTATHTCHATKRYLQLGASLHL